MQAKNIATILFCKEPKQGQGKQRLAAEIGTHEAFLVATHLLHCALEDLHTLPTTPFISPASEDSREWAESLLFTNMNKDSVLPQPNGTLGVRLKSIDDHVREKGFSKTIHMGSDCPAMNQAQYSEAIQLLEQYDFVLTPAADGGVTLMGASIPWPEMEHLPWGTDELGTTLEELCLSKGFKVGKTAPSYDVDVKEDLYSLFDDIKADSREARKKLYNHLKTVL